MKIIGGTLVLLLAAGSPSRAGLPDAAWPSVVPAPMSAVPAFAALPPVPVVVFKGLSIKGVQFSRTDRIPPALVAAIDRTE